MVQIKAGDRLKSPKQDVSFITHHAIFVGVVNGENHVVENQINVGVRLIPLDIFLRDHPNCQIEVFSGSENQRQEVVIRALDSLGKKYKLLHYNCETFANDVQYGVQESHQVKTGLKIAGSLALTTFGMFLINKFSNRDE